MPNRQLRDGHSGTDVVRREGSSGCVPGQESFWLHRVCPPLGPETRGGGGSGCHAMQLCFWIPCPFLAPLSPRNSCRYFFSKVRACRKLLPGLVLVPNNAPFLFHTPLKCIPGGRTAGVLGWPLGSLDFEQRRALENSVISECQASVSYYRRAEGSWKNRIKPRERLPGSAWDAPIPPASLPPNTHFSASGCR